MPDRRAAQPIRLFYAHVREDEDLCAKLEAHLNSLHHEASFVSLHERDIALGEDVEPTLDLYLETASLILLLMSVDFLNSDYYQRKMTRIIERHNAGEALVIPILLRPCNWQDTPFGNLLALPRNGEPITLSTNRDQAFLDVEQDLRTLLGRQSRSRPSILRDATDQSRENMLIRLQSMYEILLNDTLHPVAWIDLGLSPQPDAVENAATLLLQRTTQTSRQIQPGTSISQVYQQANQELLLLGAPGAGKSTLLYQLALDLLHEASIQPAHPLPILFPLSSWAEKRLPLATWMAEQLTSPIYEMPRKLSQHWVQEEKILPLLDGLDEMKEEARPACIAAINAYRREHPLRPLVVCSRSSEYTLATTHEHLHLQSAIEVQPLTSTQLDAILTQAGESFAGLRSELNTNPDLHELALTPLWLTVLLLTFRDATLGTLPQQRIELQQHLFQLYIQRMVEQKGNNKRYSLATTSTWLSWLAKQMLQHKQPVFALELLQANWLDDKRLRFTYQWSFLLIGGLIIGLPTGYYSHLFAGLIAGLITTLGIGLVKQLEQGRIKLAEKVIWSWKQALQWGLITLLLSLPLGWALSWLLPSQPSPIYVLIAGPLIGVVYGSIHGLSMDQNIERNTLSPGSGLLRSLKNGLRIALFIGIAIGLCATVGVALFLWQSAGTTSLLYGLLAGLIFGFSFGLTFWLFFGLSPVLEHFLLRLWIWRSGVFPFRIKTFLEDACARHLLQRIGGGYRFTHPLLQTYFIHRFTHPLPQTHFMSPHISPSPQSSSSFLTTPQKD